MNHIEEWGRINSKRARRLKEKREQRKKQAKERREGIELFLVARYAENITTNGDVYRFDYRGMSCRFCDQENRLSVAIHRPLSSKDDEEGLRELERSNPEYIEEYAYSQFLIEGTYEEVLPKVLQKIEEAIDKRWRDV